MGECVVCYENTGTISCCENNCDVRICRECILLLIEYSGNNKTLPKCVGRDCGGQYLYSIMNKLQSEKHKDIYEKLCLNHFIEEKKNDIGKLIEKEKMLEDLRASRKVFIEKKFAPSISLVANLAFGKRMKKAEIAVSEKVIQKVLSAPVTKEYKRRCMNLVCKGFLDDNLQCALCSTKFCKDCEFPLSVNHVCKEENKESIKAMENFVRCPGCSLVTERASGCLSMTCSNCQTKFEYNTKTFGGHGGHYDKLEVNEEYVLSFALKEKLSPKRLILLKEIEKKEPKEFQNEEFIILIKKHVLDNVDVKMDLAKSYEKYVLNKIERKNYAITMLQIEKNIDTIDLQDILNKYAT